MEFRNEDFDAIVAGQIDPTSYDIVLSQVTITDDRAKVVDFSERLLQEPTRACSSTRAPR